jgi:hypothetical protein
MKFMCIRNELQPTYAVRNCCRVLVVSTSEAAACNTRAPLAIFTATR